MKRKYIYSHPQSTGYYNGIFPCFFLGNVATLFSSIPKARMSF